MKKVLSVALASAMVLGMGANAFAITYSTGSNEEASWPTGFAFDGKLFVTNADDELIEESTTRLNDSESVDFEPGDTIWMPLYAKNQVVYDSKYQEGTADKDAVTTVQVNINKPTVTNVNNWCAYQGTDGIWYYETTVGNSSTKATAPAQPANTVLVKANMKSGTGLDYYRAMSVTLNGYNLNGTIYSDRDVVNNSERYFLGASEVTKAEFEKACAEANGVPANAVITVDIAAEEGTDDVAGKPINTGKTVAYGHYTGNIDKNWSINLIEKSTGVAELIEKAELYKATVTDVASYAPHGADITTNSVFLKITLKDTWKTVDSETLSYYVYIADNDSGEQTNEVWVSGKYVNNDWEYVDFDWTNDASVAKLWKVKKGENGTAVFDFADKAFFTVKMYSGESMYLDLSTAYDKAIAGEMDAEADSFYKFDNDNANFSRTGELIIVSDDSSLVPYEIDEDGNFVEVDAKYVEDYAIAHTNKKVDGFVFNTKTLGNYVLSTEELGQEEQPAEETPAEPVTPSEPTTETPSTSKPNPETGAEDFVGLAVSLAVVSVAAAGALALKK